MINTIIDMITARKQQLQSMHFKEEHFSSSESSIDEEIELKLKKKTSILSDTVVTSKYYREMQNEKKEKVKLVA